MSIEDTNVKYDRKRFSWRQCRDCVEGAVAVKIAQEVYLPMPSGMMAVTEAAQLSGDISNNSKMNAGDVTDYQSAYIPWWHNNPAYRAYLMRARFPDITANALRGLIGLSTKTDPEVNLPKKLEYIVDIATPNGLDINQLYAFCISEIFTVGKMCLVVDVVDDKFSFVYYAAEINTDWEYGVVNNKRQLTRCVFYIGDEGGKCKYWEYTFDDSMNAIVNKYIDNDLYKVVNLSYKGKPLTRLPVFPIGSIENTADPDIIPMLGLTDIALTIYRENADLSQAHFLTCNPTLFVFGMSQQEVPKVIGSTVVVGITNPQAHAEYPSTDTSALDHIRGCISDLYKEAAQYCTSFFGETDGTRQSGEALKLKQSAQGATLIHVINLVSTAIQDALKFIAEWAGISGEIKFEGNTEFAEIYLTSQDIAALVNAWLQGAIDQDTLLDNLRDANIVDSETTNEEIKQKIKDEAPDVDDVDDEEEGEDGRTSRQGENTGEK
jgi:hypothetical protein